MPKDVSSANSFDHLSYSKQEQIQKRCARQFKDDPAVQGQMFTNVMDVFKERIGKNIPILMRAFKMKDTSESGYVSLSVFHHILNYFVMPMSSQLFKQLLMSLNILPSATKIPWYEFLKTMSVKDETHSKKENWHLQAGSKKWNICSEIIDRLKKRGKNATNFFKNSFTMHNHNNKSIITRAELRRTINQALIFPLSEEEFRSLMYVLDPGHTNIIDCQTFLSLFNISEVKPDSPGIAGHKKEDISDIDIYGNLRNKELKDAIKKAFNKNFKTIEKAFYAFDPEDVGSINIENVRKILENFCFSLKDSQFDEILSDFTISGNRMYYNDFINRYKKSPYEEEEKWAHHVKRLVTGRSMPPKKLETTDLIRHVQEAVRAHRDAFLQEFKAQDYCNIGIARKEVLSKLLKRHVFRFSEEQLETLWEILPKNEIGLLKYEEFLNEWGKPYSPPSQSNGSIAVIAPEMNNNDAMSIVSERCSILSRQPSSYSRKRPQTAGSIGSIKSKASFQSRDSNRRPKSAASSLSLERAQSLKNLSINGSNHLSVQGKAFEDCGVITCKQYKQYKSMDFGLNTCLPSLKGSARSSKAESEANASLQKEKCDNAIKLTREYPSELEQQLENVVKNRWRDILRRCKVCDAECTDLIDWDQFTNVLVKTGVDSNNIHEILEKKYHIRPNQMVNYWDFLNKSLLAFNKKTTDFGRKKLQKRHPMITLGKESTGLYKALLPHRDKILKNSRDLRLAFRRADPKCTGEIDATEFRKILGLFRINLSTNDFFFIQDYFDPKLSGNIYYNEFMRVFLES